MAKKRKSRASEASPQIDAVEVPPPKPEPVVEPEAVQETVDEALLEEIEETEEIEEIEEEVEEEEDSESEENDGGSEEENKTVPENKLANGEDPQAVVEEDEDEDEESLENLLEPFSKDQLMSLLKEAMVKHPDLKESATKLADSDPSHRKIFVHGLGWDTTTETLTSVFGKYGQIEDIRAVADKNSGKSKGYGFILFKHRSGARKALQEPQKQIGNRMTSCQLASTGPVPATTPIAPLTASDFPVKKIYVSNVGADLDPQKLLEFFSKFGEIEEGPLGLDKQTGKPRGFCFFVYKTFEGAKKSLEEPHKSFEGHTLHCQKAVDGLKQGKNFSHHQQQNYGGSGDQHHHQQQQYYGGHPAKKGKYSGGSSNGPAGHLMAPAAGPTVGFNPAMVAGPALTPALGQALTALLATQGAGLGIGNFLGGLGAPQGVQPMMNNAAYGPVVGGGYGAQTGMHVGYQNPQMGSQGGNRPHHGGGYLGHGH